MKVVILAGGLGSRLSEETEHRPKPMVEIGGKPILWHIMKHYAEHGLTDFVIALGYRGDFIKRWFVDHVALAPDLTVRTRGGCVEPLDVDTGNIDDWTITLVDTGLKTQTGGRLKRLQHLLGDETFMMSWGDGVSNVDLTDLLAFHRAHGRTATLTAVRPPARFGYLDLHGDTVVEFSEKNQLKEGWINGAFFVLEPEVFDYIPGDTTHFEREPLEGLAKDGQLKAYLHTGFWQCMDTVRERNLLEAMWSEGDAPWKTWAA